MHIGPHNLPHRLAQDRNELDRSEPGRPESSTAETGPDPAFGEDGFGFGDLLDIVNPLQHIPVVSSLYREISGDEISPGAEMAGGALFGGVIGFAGSLVNQAVRAATGDDIASHVMTAFAGGEPAAPASAPAPTAAQSPTSQTVAVAARSEAPRSADRQTESATPPPSQNDIRIATAAPRSVVPENAAAWRTTDEAAAANPGGVPVRLTAKAAPRELVPARAAAPADTARPGRDIPELSPAAWTALLASIGADPAERPARPEPPAETRDKTASQPAATYNGMLAAMENALDKYELTRGRASGDDSALDATF